MTQPETFHRALLEQCNTYARLETARQVLAAHGVEISLHHEGRGVLRVQGMAEHVRFHIASPDLAAVETLLEKECQAAGVQLVAAVP